MEHIMIKSLAILSSGLVAAFALSGCIVTPAQPAYGYAYNDGYQAPAGVVYVAPTYVSPGPGYVWEYHARYGWGWHHPNRGWHRGWH